MTTLVTVLCVLIVFIVSIKFAYDAGVSDIKMKLSEKGKKIITSTIERSECMCQLEESLHEVANIGSMLLNLGLVGMVEIATFTSTVMDKKFNALKQSKNDELKEEAAKIKPNVCPNPELTQDIIHTKKKGTTRKVLRDKNGHFVKKVGRTLPKTKKNK